MHVLSNRWRKSKSDSRRKRVTANRKNAAKRGQNNVNNVDKVDKDCQNKSPKDYDFLLVHTSGLKELLKNVKCNECHSQTEVLFLNEKGFSSLIKLKCCECEAVLSECYSSPKVNKTQKGNSFIVNRKVTDSINSIGLGYAALQKICMVLNMNCISSRSFYDHLKNLSKEVVELEEKVLINARNSIREVYAVASNYPESSNSIIDIAGSYDGTWLTRGHSSLYGNGIIIDALTGLVIDFEICSKYCPECSVAKKKFENDNDGFKVWHAQHLRNGDCNTNFEGSSGSMEVEAAKRIWSRSISKNQMRYTTMISDGDCKSWTALKEMAPYDEIVIEKEECINHVHKRLGTALRKVAKSEGLGGKKPGALTQPTIIKLQSFYRQAIVNNAPDVGKIKVAMQATLDHCSSTDSNPKHGNCPKGRNSWCFYNKALSEGFQLQMHSTMKTKLNDKVLAHVLPIYDRLASEELLGRCTKLQTQNANESLHSLIWRKCPKEIFVSKRRIHMAAVNAIAEHNMGLTQTFMMKASIRNEEVARNVLDITTRRDNLKRKRNSDEYQDKRKSLRQKKKYARKANSTADYGAGLH